MTNVETFECLHCDKGFRTAMQLRCHINRTRVCKEKIKLLKEAEQNKKMRLDEVASLPDKVIVEEEIVYENDVVEELTNPNLTLEQEFDPGFELMKFVKSCFGGRGLSIKDTDKLIELVKNPKFIGSSIPYNNGKAANLWLTKKLESINGPSQVIYFFNTYFYSI